MIGPRLNLSSQRSILLATASGLVSLAASWVAFSHHGIWAQITAAGACLVMLGAGVSALVKGWSRSGAVEHLREAIEPMAEGIAFFDADDNLVVWNPRYAELVDPAGVLQAGLSFRQLLEGNVNAGAHPEAVGHEPEWIDTRASIHSRS